jgi:hypothetical protein
MKLSEVIKTLPNRQRIRLYNRESATITVFDLKDFQPYPLDSGITTDSIKNCYDMKVVRIDSDICTEHIPKTVGFKTDSSGVNVTIPVKSIINIVVVSDPEKSATKYNNKYQCIVKDALLSDIEIDEVFIFRNCKFRKISDDIFTSRYDIEHGSPNCLNLENKHRVSLMNNCSVSKIINTEV